MKIQTGKFRAGMMQYAGDGAADPGVKTFNRVHVHLIPHIFTERLRLFEIYHAQLVVYKLHFCSPQSQPSGCHFAVSRNRPQERLGLSAG